MTSRTVTPALLRDWPLTEPGAGKDSRGHVLVLGGGCSTPGAVLLAGEAALRVGAGKLAAATARTVAPTLAVAVPEAQVTALDEDDEGCIDPAAAATCVERARSADVLLAGPGLDDPDRATALLAEVLPHVEVPVVLDALGTAYLTHRPDGLRHLAGRAVVTANPTELARMTGRDDEEVADDPLDAAGSLAARADVVVLAGGETKHVATPDGRCWVVEGGTPGLGVSGSGDVQAGIVAGLLAREGDPAKAAVWGAYLHARVGERLSASVGTVGFLARELTAEVPAVLRELG
jgi:ADP-dependent NAD(P)H-hydrate dehydratase